MKQILILNLFVSMLTAGYAKNIVFTDANFKKALLTHDPVIDTNDDGEISVSEAEAVTHLFVSASESNTESSIKNIKEIEYFINLVYLRAKGNSLTKIDVSNNSALEALIIYGNKIDKIDLTNNPSLYFLNVANNNISTLDVRKCSSLSILNFNGNTNLKSVSMNIEQNIPNIVLDDCPNLEFICIDKKYQNSIKELLEKTNQTKVNFSSNCYKNSMALKTKKTYTTHVVKN